MIPHRFQEWVRNKPGINQERSGFPLRARVPARYVPVIGSDQDQGSKEQLLKPWQPEQHAHARTHAPNRLRTATRQAAAAIKEAKGRT